MKKFPSAMLPITFSWIVGILLASVLSIPFWIVIFTIVALITLSFVKNIRNIVIILSFFFLAFFRVNVSQFVQTNHIKNLLTVKTDIQQPIKGRIVSEVNFNGKRNFAELELIEIKGLPVQGKISFSFDDNLQYGDIIETIAFLQKYNNSSNPFSFDYAEFLEFKKIYGKGYPKTEIKIIESERSLLKIGVINVRSWLRNRINERFGEYSGFIRAILIGEKQDLSDWKQKLNQAGLSHILAVSGLHVGILSLVFFLILKIIFRNRYLSRILLILILLFYAAICGWTPSVTRAVIMISLYLISKMIQRKPNSNSILATSLFIITIFDPKQLFSIGLQLSFTAVFILLNILPQIRYIKLKRDEIILLSFGKKILNGILTLMFSSAIISICLAPVTMYYFHQFNLNGILANLIAIPLISLILPLSIVIIILPSFVAVYYIFSFKIVMQFFNFWSNLSASLPLHFDFLRFNSWQFFISLILLISFPIIKNFKKRKLTLTLYTLFFVNIAFSFINLEKDVFKITFFDCDVGDMFLIEADNSQKMLIDTGPPEFSKKHFKYSALGYFQKKGISEIDYIIITHAHNDHYGGLEYILINMKVKNLVMTDDFQKRGIWNYLKKFVTKDTNIITVNDVMNISTKDYQCQIIHPDKNYFHGNINNMSIVIHLDFDELQVLFTGDIEEEGEEYLLHNYCMELDADILKIGHHGSKTSSTSEFIEKVSPDYAFIPTSMKNKFAFPHKITLQKYDFLGKNLFIAGIDGALQVSSDGKSAVFKTFKSKRIVYASELN
ncbi:MAG: DNA internalization-related competence protein ComEC/Rec2 [Candidatus Cloacimonetes bacterium]|nr:DNA internalization-related competence protein ComEC/Rec2 [Candidatus Cloacimonadota bacterium]